ncbi:MAG TPA: metabolite traffic protein EboE [Kiritimatiellia bacterium]|nr:metabolite traffic protein EboE [Kiritimatiellia bacterium]
MNAGTIQQPLHLSYCMNVHPGESGEDVLAGLRTGAAEVKRRLGRSGGFGVGLRLGAAAVRDLSCPEGMERLKSALAEEDLYAFTVNGFPYGSFHGVRVKEGVYAPDWRTEERLDYTLALARMMVELVPSGLEPSISTVPVSYGGWIRDEEDRLALVGRLATCAVELHRLELETGTTVRVGLEPEPGCVLETTDEVIAFFEEQLFREGSRVIEEGWGLKRYGAEAVLRRHLGVCLDTCHVALAHEDPLAVTKRLGQHGIGVVKVQVSAALEVADGTKAKELLQTWDEPVYLHQVRGIRPDGSRGMWSDLPDYLADAGGPLKQVRVHFHVPLTWAGEGELWSTVSTMGEEWFDWLKTGDCPHVETETYTYSVLPEALRGESVAGMIAGELEWALGRITRASPKTLTAKPGFAELDPC